MKKHTYYQALDASVKYFNGDELAAKVFVDKYALQNQKSEYLELTPTDMHKRLAKNFARIENKYINPISENEIFGLLDHFKYIIPQGSPMSTIGNPYQVQSLSNCFVVQGVYSDKLDSFGGIMHADQEIAQIFKRRGGCGIDISGIRPKDAPTNNAAKTTDGIAVFMEMYSNTVRNVAQHGRRGALIITISINHPEIETFINIKKDLKKVTGANISIKVTDEFMNAVKNDEEYTLRYPVDKSPEEAKIIKKVRAKNIWDQFIQANWQSAEPGILFWGAVQKNTPGDIYSEEGYETISVNPCVSGDTLIAVADGRNYVSIKQLAEEGKDTPVYSINKKNNKIEIKMGRAPRTTGFNQKLLRVMLDDGTYLDVTPNHKFILLDGKEVEAKDLNNGDSLCRFDKTLEKVKKDSKNYYRVYGGDSKVYEHRLIANFFHQQEWDDLYDVLKKNGFVQTGGVVVHHKDYNQLNNSPDNLEIMTFKNHVIFHNKKDNSGENNGKYCGVKSEKIRELALDFTKKIGHRFSTNEWVKFAKKNGLPKQFSEFRLKELGTIIDLSKWCANELGMKNVDCDPRVIKTYKLMLDQGYNAYIKKECAFCNNSFSINHLGKEKRFCSLKCSAINNISNEEYCRKMRKNSEEYYIKRAKIRKEKQLKIFMDLKFKLGRHPFLKEWEDACKEQNIPRRLGNIIKHGFKSFDEIKEASYLYNHKVVQVVEIDGLHTVYNITVDDNHNYVTVTSVKDCDKGQRLSGIFVKNCGELLLAKDSTCILLSMNLGSYVQNPFTNSAFFDYDLFNKHVIIAQRLIDNMVDLEIECVNKIIKKVNSDPEPIEVKQIELNLWKKIKNKIVESRRTGLGITALADTMAMMNIKYGSEESIKLTEEIYKALGVAAHTSSCILAKERGAFSIFNYQKEKDHPYLSRMIGLCSPEIQEMWKTTGRRNIALTTTAPTGSISVVAQTSSGIEPVYSLSYTRRKKINPSDKIIKVDFTDQMGDMWQEFTVYHHGLHKWMQATSETDIANSPYWGATSNDIDWMASVKIQAVAQKYIDHSLSKTCNLPETATKELISEIYMSAWESGCKGFTVYRDGCRDGVLISGKTSDRPKDIQPAPAPARPNELLCDIKKVKINSESWTVFVGLLNGKPYEIFGGLSKYVDIPNKYKAGRIVKNGKIDGISTYNVVIGENDEQMIIKDIANAFENKNYGAFTRTLSLAIRHGAPIQFVVEQLHKDKYSDITSFSSSIARVLKSYIKDGLKVSGKKCEGCDKEGTLIYQEGCMICSNCKWSKCS